MSAVRVFIRSNRELLLVEKAQTLVARVQRRGLEDVVDHARDGLQRRATAAEGTLGAEDGVVAARCGGGAAAWFRVVAVLPTHQCSNLQDFVYYWIMMRIRTPHAPVPIASRNSVQTRGYSSSRARTRMS